MRLAIDLAVQCEQWSAVAELESLADAVVEACLSEVGLVLTSDAELSLLFCDDATIRSLNLSWRGQDKATNVLSFPVSAEDDCARPRIFGDIVVAYETTRREADEQGKSLSQHLAHLLSHGFLHLLGFDHENAPDAERMEDLERGALARLGVADPYADQDLESR